jgi:DNA helicase II / ATP-dependent DNA helicase PcrA
MDAQFQQRNAEFRAFLDTLNPEQRQAVDHTEGPLLVLAGPGTGKTQVLAARIGNILLSTDARPQNVLCLTFTDAGVHAMRQRLLALIGPDAHRVPIMTYHAFCNRIIQDNLEYFGRADLQPVTDLERIEVIRGLLDQLPPGHPLADGARSAYPYERQVRHLFGAIKSEHWKPGYIHRQIDAWIGQLPDNQDFIFKRKTKNAEKGDLKTDKIADETARMERLRAAADLYPKYVAAMQRADRYEYDDMLLWVLRAFEKHPTLLRSQQERYLYLLVDEYQDTNGAQNRLLQMLTEYWAVPNICIVGDDDQSIYEFQGARLQNLLDFYTTHREHLRTVVLTRNYRSTQPILDAAHRVIEHNHLRAARSFDLEVSKVLLAQQSSEPTTLRVDAYANRLAEDVGVVSRIADWVASGVPPDSIAVLYARHKQARRVMDLLEKMGIPFETKRPANLLELPLVGYLRDILRYVADEQNEPFSGEFRLFRLLHAPFWGIDPIELATFAARLRQHPDTTWRAELALSGWPRARWLAHLPAADTEASQLVPLMERIVTESGLLDYALSLPDKTWHLQVLHTWMTFVQNEAARTPRFDLERLLALLDTLQDHRLSLSLQQQVRTHEGRGVQLLTAHSAKGLEFERVLVLDCCADAWDGSSREGLVQFALPPTLTLSGEEDAVEARRRLFFVAITRAKRYLHVSYAERDDAGKPLTQARFVDEMGVEKTHTSVETADVLAAQVRLVGMAERPVVTLPEVVWTTDFLDNLTLSVTGFNRYLRCPLAFFYEDVLRVPGTTSAAITFGLAMHAALQQFFLKMQRDPKREWPDTDYLLEQFGRDMDRRQGVFGPAEWQQRVALGQKYLTRYRPEQVPYWRKRARVEHRMERVNLDNGGAVLTGTLDKVEWLDNGTLRIVDYKTGVPQRSKTEPPSEAQPHGGTYWRQLFFYKIMLEKSGFYAESAQKGLVAWVEWDKRGQFQNYEIEFAPEQVRFVENLIGEVWARIQQRDFATGCGEPTCAWCQMHVARHIPAFRERVEDGLDD